MREIFELILWIGKILLSPILIGVGLIAGFVELIVSLFGWYIIILIVVIIFIAKLIKS